MKKKEERKKMFCKGMKSFPELSRSTEIFGKYRFFFLSISGNLQKLFGNNLEFKKKLVILVAVAPLKFSKN